MDIRVSKIASKFIILIYVTFAKCLSESFVNITTKKWVFVDFFFTSSYYRVTGYSYLAHHIKQNECNKTPKNWKYNKDVSNQSFMILILETV